MTQRNEPKKAAAPGEIWCPTCYASHPRHVRVPWPHLQLQAGAIDRARMLSAVLKTSVGDALLLLVNLWGWGRDLGCPEQPPSGVLTSPVAETMLCGAIGWAGERDLLISGLVGVGALEVLEDGIRVRGMKAYFKAWRDRRNTRRRMRKMRGAQRVEPVTRNSPVTCATNILGRKEGKILAGNQLLAATTGAPLFTQPEEISNPSSLPVLSAKRSERAVDRADFVAMARRLRIEHGKHAVDGDFAPKYNAARGEGWSRVELEWALEHFFGTPERPGFGVTGVHDGSLSLFFSGTKVWRERCEIARAVMTAEASEAGEAKKVPTTPAERAWDQVLKVVEADGKSYALSHLVKLEAIDVRDGELVLAAPDKWFKVWVDDNYRKLIEDALAGVPGPRTFLLESCDGSVAGGAERC